MKKIFTRFVVLALVAVVVYSCGKKSDSAGADSSSKEGAAAGNLKIAYVHTDSVINKYDFFKKRSEEITEKGKKLDLDLQARAKGFEQEVAIRSESEILWMPMPKFFDWLRISFFRPLTDFNVGIFM